MLYSYYQLYHHCHLVYCGSLQVSPRVLLLNMTPPHSTFGSLPFVNALFLKLIVPPSASCCLLCFNSSFTMAILLPSVTLQFFACHICFLTLCECSTVPINCSTIGILLSIVVHFKCHRGYLVTHCVTLILCMQHLVLNPL